MSVDTLFTDAEIADASAPTEVPRWVVEVNELLLFTYGGSASGAATWWAQMAGRSGIEARTVYIGITPAGALLHIACEDKEEAEFFASYMHGKGCHTKAAVVRRIGHTITCSRCGDRKPLWVRLSRSGQLCRACAKSLANWAGSP